MVKVCEKCGIVNSERAEECENCTAELGEAIKNSEAKKLIRQIAKRNARTKEAIANEKFGGMEEDIPEIPVTPARIVVGIIGCLAALGTVAFMVILGILQPVEETTMLIMSNFGILLLIGLAVFICFKPTTWWALTHWKYEMYYKEMPQPSDTGLALQVVGCVMLILCAVALLVMEILMTFNLF